MAADPTRPPASPPPASPLAAPGGRVGAVLVAATALVLSAGCARAAPVAAPAASVEHDGVDGDDGVPTLDGEPAPVGGSRGGDGGGEAGAGHFSAPMCATFAPPVQLGVVDNPDLDELSGLAASRRHPGVLWTHNDSGEKKGRLYALDAGAAHVATLQLEGVEPVDWEDVALGRCSADAADAHGCLWVADTGDNGHARDEVSLLRVVEPHTLPAPGKRGRARRLKVAAGEVAVFALRYPPRPELTGKARAKAEHPDVEALAMLPDGRALLLDKRDDGRSTVFRLAPLDGAVAVAERLGELDLRDATLSQGASLRATAADLDATGRALLVRCYFRVYAFDVGDALAATSAASPAAWAAAPRLALTGGFDIQGEALAWTADGGFVHTSETKGQPLWKVACADN